MSGTLTMQHRGGVLLETLIALALFVGAAAFALGATRNIFSAIDHAQRRMEAVDLARSKMAELEAGFITVGDLRGEFDASSLRIGSQRRPTQVDAPSAAARRWALDVRTRRTEFTGLTLVELSVREIDAMSSGGGQNEGGVNCTIRQLVALRRGEAQQSETDDITESEDAPEQHEETLR